MVAGIVMLWFERVCLVVVEVEVEVEVVVVVVVVGVVVGQWRGEVW